MKTVYEERYSDGQLKMCVNYKDGKEDGPREWYFPNGQLQFRSNYKDGKLDGLWEVWNENGQLICSPNDYKFDKDIFSKINVPDWCGNKKNKK